MSALFALALVLLVAGVCYHQVFTWFDLYPFNNVRQAKRSEQRTETLVNVPILTLPIVLLVVATALGLPVAAYVAGGLELLFVLGGLLLWWLPYLTGRTVPWATSGTGQSWAEMHARTYASTVIVLPAYKNRPRPNLEHMLLHAILLTAGVTSLAYAGTL
jgi:hypothetical protein